MSHVHRLLVAFFLILPSAGAYADTPESTRVADPNQHASTGGGSYPYRDKSDYVLRELDLKPGDVVVDIGAGDGWWTEKMAQCVGPEGTVHAAEVDEKKVDKLKERFADVPQVKPYLCPTDGTGLPENSCDLAFLSKVYHHLDDGGRVDYWRHLREVVRPTGRVCVIERHPGLASSEHGKEHAWPPGHLIQQAAEAGWIAVRYELITGTYHYLAIFVQKDLFPPELKRKKPAEGQTAKILLIGHKPDHPPGTHMYLNECGLLAKCLRQSPGVEAVVSDGWPKDAGVLEGVDAIVLYTSPGAELLLKGPQGDEVERLLTSGVGLAAIHWATGIGNKDDAELADRYLNRLGGLFSFGFSGLATTNSRVEHVAPEHPVSRGCADYDLTDEFYLDLKFLPSATPILKVRVNEKEQTVAWVYERPDSGGGRSYGNALGHFHENFGIEPFRRALVNAILWTAHYEVPAGGAPCSVTEEDMKLPDAG